MSLRAVPDRFLDDHPRRRGLNLAGAGLAPVAAFDGRGSHPLEVALAIATRRPRAEELRTAWKRRHGGTPSPLLLVVAYETGGTWRAAICGPIGDEPPVEPDLGLSLVERIAAAALDQPSRNHAIRFLGGILAEVESELPGIRNHGMLATHELREGVPQRADWQMACEYSRPLLSSNGRDLVERLGFHIEQHSIATTILSVGEARCAVAVFLDETEEFEAPAARFGDTSPVTHALAYADRAELPWVVVTRGFQIRLYSARPDVGVGRKGRADTYVEANLALIPDDSAGYVTLLFSADALRSDGTLTEILEASRDHATALGARLRDRVYEEAVPSLALALARRHVGPLDEVALDMVNEQTLTVLFRLLFVAYAEDKDLLPYRSNGAYRDHALKTRARDLAERRARGQLVFDSNATDLWDEVVSLWTAVDKGNVERGVPPYDGGLFSSDSSVNVAGGALAGLTLSNAEFGPALVALVVDDSEDAVAGPVDFRSLSVREFGTIYEGLLESSLSVAPADLALDNQRNYVPARDGAEVVVRGGEVYFHNRSGARKSSGSYFTKSFAVEHLLDQALEPALDDHLARIRELVDFGEDAKAAEAFFDFRCIDIAMGSGHFLVAAIDRIEARLSAFLALNPVPHVTAELNRLRAHAYDALGPLGAGIEIEQSSLLRRQVARRCIYGVDLNPIAVELARLGVWIHTFVPGLPLSFLDHSLISGDSLTGIGTLEEAIQALDPEHVPGQASLFRGPIVDVLGRAEAALHRLARIMDATARDIEDARDAQSEAVMAVQPAHDLFDLIIAGRLDAATSLTAFNEEEIAENPDLSGARELASDLRSLHFPIAFPEVFVRERAGFDCILGNPPWDKVIFEAQQFWVSRAPGLNAVPLNRRESEIERLRSMRPEDAELEVREKAARERFQRYAERAFSLRGRGHYDLAKFFVERALRLAGSSGSIGYVLPGQCLLLGGWSRLREAMLTDSGLSVLQARNKRGWLFDEVEHRNRMILLARVQRSVTGCAAEVQIWPGVTGMDAMRRATAGAGTRISPAELRELSDSLVIPWLDHASAGIVFQAYRNCPSLNSGNGWIHGSHDARWDFRTSGPDRPLVVGASTDSWRALMTRHVDGYRLAWDEPFQTYVSPTGLAAAGRGVISDDAGCFALNDDHPRIVFRHPSTNDNARTLIAALLPGSGVVHNKGYVHAVALEHEATLTRTLALLGYMNSLTCDWWVRRFVDRHISAPVVNNLRLPVWDEETCARVASIVSEIVRRSDPQLEEYVSVPSARVERRANSDFELLAEIEVAALQGVGLDRLELEVILDDFTENGCPSELRVAIREQLGSEA